MIVLTSIIANADVTAIQRLESLNPPWAQVLNGYFIKIIPIKGDAIKFVWWPKNEKRTSTCLMGAGYFLIRCSPA